MRISADENPIRELGNECKLALQGRKMISDRCVDMLKLLADETRWRMLNALVEAPADVSELTERLGVSQYNASKHLRILREGGLIVTQRVGRRVVCSISPGFRAVPGDAGWVLDFGCCSFRFDIPPKGCKE